MRRRDVGTGARWTDYLMIRTPTDPRAAPQSGNWAVAEDCQSNGKKRKHNDKHQTVSGVTSHFGIADRCWLVRSTVDATSCTFLWRRSLWRRQLSTNLV